MDILGLSPYLPDHRPRGRPRWWWAAATGGSAGSLRIEEVGEGDAPPAPRGLTGLAAPCSLPAEFLQFLTLSGERTEILRGLAERTPSRLLEDARRFAAGQQRGERHPRRAPGESISSLDRTQLPLLCASLPLLRSLPLYPHGEPEAPSIVEVQVPAFLDAMKIAALGRAGARPAAVRRRAEILDRLREGAAGFAVEVRERDHALASAPALDACVACAAAAWLARHPEAHPSPGTPAFWPVPAR